MAIRRRTDCSAKPSTAAIIDRHLPPDPQRVFSHGRVLSLLLAARLCQPTALINVPAWAADTGADLLWDIPAARLNDDRPGRALEAFFYSVGERGVPTVQRSVAR